MAAPYGPLELADMIGLDVVLATLRQLHNELGDDKYRPCPLLIRLVDSGLLGRKVASGFYHYDDYDEYFMAKRYSEQFKHEIDMKFHLLQKQQWKYEALKRDFVTENPEYYPMKNRTKKDIHGILKDKIRANKEGLIDKEFPDEEYGNLENRQPSQKITDELQEYENLCKQTSQQEQRIQELSEEYEAAKENLFFPNLEAAEEFNKVRNIMKERNMTEKKAEDVMKRLSPDELSNILDDMDKSMKTGDFSFVERHAAKIKRLKRNIKKDDAGLTKEKD